MARFRWMVWVLLLFLIFTPLLELAQASSHHHPVGKHHGPRGHLRNTPGIVGPAPILLSNALIGWVVIANLVGVLPLFSVSLFVPPRA